MAALDQVLASLHSLPRARPAAALGARDSLATGCARRSWATAVELALHRAQRPPAAAGDRLNVCSAVAGSGWLSEGVALRSWGASVGKASERRDTAAASGAAGALAREERTAMGEQQKGSVNAWVEARRECSLSVTAISVQVCVEIASRGASYETSFPPRFAPLT